MKNLILCAALAACAAPALAQSDVAVETLPPAPQSAATADALVWKFAPPVGSKWQLRTFSRIRIQQNIPAEGSEPAMKTDATMIQSLIADYDVLSRDQFGASTIRITYRTLKSDVAMKLDGKAVPIPDAQSAHLSKTLDGATYTIKQAPDGVIWGAVGMKAFQRRMLEASGVTDPAEQQQIMELTDSYSSEKALKSLSLMAGKLPPYPVRGGESWTYQASLPAATPIQMDISGKRTLKTLAADSAVIAESARYDGASITLPTRVAGNGPKIVVKMTGMSGNISGTTRIERQSGVPLETTINQVLDGVLNVQISDKTGKIIKSTRVPQKSQVLMRVVLEPR